MSTSYKTEKSTKRLQVDLFYYSMLFYFLYEIFDREAFANPNPPAGSSMVTSDGTIIHSRQIDNPEPVSQGISITNKRHCYNPETDSYTDCKASGDGVDGGSMSTLVIGGLVILAAAGAGAAGGSDGAGGGAGGGLAAAPLSLAPTAVDDFGAAFTTNQNTAFTTGNVIDNDVDPDPPPSDLSFGTLITSFPPLSGTLTVNGDGTFDFDPDGDFDSLGAGESRSVAFEYTVLNGDASDVGLILLSVNGVNDVPIAVDDDFAIDEDGVLFGLDVLVNDADFDLNDVLFISGHNPGTAMGTVVLNIDDTFNYAPGAAFDYLGTGELAVDTFTYTVSDGTLQDTATVRITITGVNDGPTANDDNVLIYTSSTSGLLPGDVKLNDVDPDTPHNILTVTMVNGSALNVGSAITGMYGDLTLMADGTFVYDLDQGNITVANLASGATINDTFSYELSDNEPGAPLTDTADLIITIAGNNAPTDIMGVPTSVTENTSTVGGLLIGNLTSTDIDPGDLGVFSIPTTGSADQGKFEITNTNELRVKETYHLNHEAQSTLVVDVMVTDMGGAEYVETFTINVLDVAETLDAAVINMSDTLTSAEQPDLVFLDPGSPTFSSSYALTGPEFIGFNSIATDDLNEDGHIDLYLTNTATGFDRVFFNDGTGTLVLDPSQSIPNADFIGRGPLLGDIDNDGDVDVVTPSFTNTMEIFENVGNGVFVNTGQVFGALVVNPQELEFADFNLDGHLDIGLVTSIGEVRIYNNDGFGNFSFVDSVSVGGATIGINVGEFNGIAGADIFLTNASGSHILHNDGAGGFDSGSVTALGASMPAFDAIVADFNGDTFDDIIVGSFGNGPAIGTLQIYLTTGIGTFAPPTIHNTVDTFVFEAGDYEGDGDMDLFVSSVGAIPGVQNEPNEIWLNNGAGSFTLHTLSTDLFNTVDLIFDDLNSI